LTTADDLSLAQFEQELSRFAHSRKSEPKDDALGHVIGLVKENPSHARSRLLARILSALSGMQASFRPAEVGSLDSSTIGLVQQLIVLRRTGTVKPETWTSAADTTRMLIDAA